MIFVGLACHPTAAPAELPVRGAFDVELGSDVESLTGYTKRFGDEYGEWWQRRDAGFFEIIDVQAHAGKVFKIEANRFYDVGDGMALCRQDLAIVIGTLRDRYPRLTVANAYPVVAGAFTLAESAIEGRPIGRAITAFCMPMTSSKARLAVQHRASPEERETFFRAAERKVRRDQARSRGLDPDVFK